MAVAGTGEQTHPAVPLTGDQPVSVVLDLVNPLRADRRFQRSGRDAGINLTGRFAGGFVQEKGTGLRRFRRPAHLRVKTANAMPE
jgi:hypothetical protein